ncbi:MAG: hypothetical protein GY942_24575, partial [Aestuariibacter sp.]|nr:hypothetical protein [Aestuariibacter sp.]
MTDTVLPPVTEPESLPALKPGRHIALEFLLHFCTFGIYTCFWCVTATRDLKRAFNKEFTPLAWFWVPLVFLAQVFMLPRLLSAIEEAEQAQNLKGWSDWTNRLWLILTCGIGLFFAITSKIDISVGWVLFGLLL